MIFFSFNKSRLATVWGGFSTEWYGRLLANDQVIAAALLSLKIALSSATLATLLGTMAGMALARFRRFHGRTLFSGLVGQGVPAAVARQVSDLPPVGSLFAAFLGHNPIQSLLAPTGALGSLSRADSATLTGRQFFPHLMSTPFHHGLVIVFSAAAAMTFVGAIASLLRGSTYVHVDEPAPEVSTARAPGALEGDDLERAVGA